MGLVNVSYEIKTSENMSIKMLDDMLNLIRDGVKNAPNPGDLLFRSKYILTELLTNAIKHDHGASRLKIEITDKAINVVKTDTGKPLTLPTASKNIPGVERIVTADTMHTLYTNKQGQRLYFYCQQTPDHSVVVNNRLPEHFGLLIITKAADEFYYTYNHEEQLNTFSATIKLA